MFQNMDKKHGGKHLLRDDLPLYLRVLHGLYNKNRKTYKIYAQLLELENFNDVSEYQAIRKKKQQDNIFNKNSSARRQHNKEHKRNGLNKISKMSRSLPEDKKWKIFNNLHRFDQFTFLVYKQLIELSGNGEDWKAYTIMQKRKIDKKCRSKPEYSEKKRVYRKKNRDLYLKRCRDWRQKMKSESPIKWKEQLKRERERYYVNWEENKVKGAAYGKKNREKIRISRYKIVYGDLWEVASLTYKLQKEIRNDKEKANQESSNKNNCKTITKGKQH